MLKAWYVNRVSMVLGRERCWLSLVWWLSAAACLGLGCSGCERSAGQGPIPDASGPPELTALSPEQHQGGEAFTLSVFGRGLSADDVVRVDDQAVNTNVLSEMEARAVVPAMSRGWYDVTVARGGAASNSLSLEITNTAPVIVAPGSQVLAEEQNWELVLEVADLDGDELRVLMHGLPPGAHWDEPARTLRFRPDFIQGGQSWEVSVEVSDGLEQVETSFDIEVTEEITPDPPDVVSQQNYEDHMRLELEQTTDPDLAEPLEAKLERLMHDEISDHFEELKQTWEDERGEELERPEQLIGSGGLAELPVDPLGGEWVRDVSGAIVSTQVQAEAADRALRRERHMLTSVPASR